MAKANGGRVSLEDCKRKGMGTGLAEMRLGILAEKGGWTKKKLKSGLMAWWPPQEASE